MKHLLFGILLAASTMQATTVQAKPAFIGEDFSGVYRCIGNDAREGKYTGTVTLTLNPEHSYSNYGSYAFKLEVTGFGTYLGHAAVSGRQAAIHFALEETASKDFGTGIATFSKGKGKHGKVSFHKFYYEPEYKGGNTGTEDCTRK